MERRALSGVPSITTPDQRLRVFVSSTLTELAEERLAARTAIESLRLAPVMFELGARPHPPQDLYRAYLEQSHVFVGIYWQSYGWIAPGESLSGIEDEYRLSEGRPRLIYIKEPAKSREPALERMLDGVRSDAMVSYKRFSSAEQLRELLLDDLAVLISERFASAGGQGPTDMPTGTVTFLFTDIEGSTRLLRELGEDYVELLARHDHLIRQAIAKGEGTEVGTEGDSFFAAFPTAVGAVRAAVYAQQAMAAEPWPRGVRVRARIGLHTGEGRLGGGAYIGLDVHRAARISAASNGGQVLLSSTTAEMVRPTLPAEVRLRDLGLHSLKDFDNAEHLYQLVIEGLQSEFPAPRSMTSGRGPTPLTPLVGRETDLRSARDLLLHPDVRLVTITGPGGTGKTRLALELMRLLEPDFPGGVQFVDLSGFRDPGLVLPAIGHALGVLDAEGRDIAAATGLLLGEAQILVVLDNLEQVIAAARDVSGLLGQTMGLKILATSREPLRIQGEYEYPLNPLLVPKRDTSYSELQGIPAIDLFVQRARAVVPYFAITEANATVIAELVRYLDGLPLAIELAAPRLRALSPEALLERVEQRLDVLRSSSRDMPERHHSFRAAISWSYNLLDEDAQRLLRRLGVFRGGWTLDAARAVCTSEDLDEDRLLDLLNDLVTKSLVRFDFDADEPRYRLLETVREFALEQLVTAREDRAARLALVKWCVDFAATCERRYQASDLPQVLDRIELERDNIRAALECCLTDELGVEDGLLIAGFLWLYWDVRGYSAEGASWLQRLLSTPQASKRTRGRAVALDASGWLGRLRSDSTASEEAFSEADQIWEELGDRRWLAWSLAMHGLISYNFEQPERAKKQFEKAALIAREIEYEPLLEGWSDFGLGHVFWASGDPVRAEQLILRSLEIARRWNHTWATGHAQFSLGILAFMKGEVAMARRRLDESLRLRRDVRDIRGIADCLGAMALLSGADGDQETAAILLGSAEAQRQAAGQMLVPWQQPLFDQTHEVCLANLGEDRFATAFERGRALSRDEAVVLALDTTAPVEVD